MKLIYFTLFWAFTLVATAQDNAESGVSPENKSYELKLYPNPAFGDIVHISTNRNGIKDIVVYDVFGKAVLKERINTSSLDISPLVPGVYLLQLRQNNNAITRKFVVK